MTLFAFALSDDDSRIVVASDVGMIASVERPPPGFPPAAIIPVHKLVQVHDLPLIWGIAGSAADSPLFAQWIDAQSFASWEDLAQGATDKIHELQQAALRRGHAAKTKRDQIETARLLIAGFVGGVPRTFMVDQDGEAIWLQNIGLNEGFVGVWTPPALITLGVVRAFDPGFTLAKPATMRRFLSAFCDRAPGLQGPPDVYTITSEGCSEYRVPGGDAR